MLRFLIALSFFSSFVFAAPIAPLAVGNEWTYTVKSSYPGCPNGDHKAKVIREVEKSGRTAFEVQGACIGYGPGYQTVSDDVVDSEYAGRWWRMIDAPVEEGHKWYEFRANAVWRKIGSLKVQAGTFDDCWRKVRGVSYTDWSEYCRGVGLVRSHMVDLGGGYIDMELKSYALTP